jgi:Gas vesicle protein
VTGSPGPPDVPPDGGLMSTSTGAQISLVDLLDRLLGTGVVLAGDVLISLAGVDLVQVRLHALITTVRSDRTEARDPDGGGP